MCIFSFIRHNHVTGFIKMLNSCFLFMQGPELMNKYVGESERAVREVRFCLKVELCIGEPHFCPLVSILYFLNSFLVLLCFYIASMIKEMIIGNAKDRGPW